MRKVTLFRLGVAAGLLTMGVAGVFAAGCSGDDNTTTDAGTTNHDSGPGTDTGTGGDTGPVADAGPADHAVADAGQHAKLIIIHAAAGAPAVRVCFAQGVQDDGSDGTVASLPALPDAPTPPPLPGYPGIFPGTGGTFPDITDLSGVAITPYALLAASISGITSDAGTGEKTCTDLIDSDGKGTKPGNLKLGVDYLKLPTIKAKTFLKDHTYLLSLLGCLPNVTADGGSAGFTTDRCGASYNATTGNISVGIADLDRSTPADGGFGIQFANRSTALEGTAFPAPYHDPAAVGVVPALFYNAQVPGPTPDAGDDAGDAAPADAGTVTVTVPKLLSATPVKATGTGTTGVVDVTAPQLTDPSLLFGAIVPSLDGGATNPNPYPYGDILALPVSVIQALTYGGATPPVCAPGSNCTYILLGDPTQQPLAVPNPDGGSAPVQNPNYDGRGLHMLAFPNDPPVKKLGQ